MGCSLGAYSCCRLHLIPDFAPVSRSRSGLSRPLYQKQLPDSSHSSRCLGFIFFVVLHLASSWNVTADSQPYPHYLELCRAYMLIVHPWHAHTWTSSIQRGPVTRDIFTEWKSHVLGHSPFSSPRLHAYCLIWSHLGAAEAAHVGFHFTDEDTLLDCLLNVTLWLRQARSCCSWLSVQCFSVSTFPPALDCRQRKWRWNKNESFLQGTWPEK